MNKKYYSVLGYAKKKNVSSQTIYNQIKKNIIDYISVDLGKNNNKKGYVIIVEED